MKRLSFAADSASRRAIRAGIDSGRRRSASLAGAIGAALWLLGAGALAQPIVADGTTAPQIAPLPQHLRDTGLYANGTTQKIDARNIAFAPQYPLWSDGTTKRRWLYLPPGTAIDASDPDAWEFPIGTKLWKEFGYVRPVETRYIERLADGSWRFAAYVWNEQGADAVLAPARGIAAVPASGAPGGRYAIPSRNDCLACHEGAAVPVLGVGALQLSPDRDPLAPHAEAALSGHADLHVLVERGLLRKLPAALLKNPPRIEAPTQTARAALGYLHGNCGHCHNDSGPLANLDLALQQRVADSAKSAARTIESLVGHVSRYRAHGTEAATKRVVPGAKEASVLAERMVSNNPLARMPPLGVRVADAEGVALIERWIHHDLLHPRKEPAR